MQMSDADQTTRDDREQQANPAGAKPAGGPPALEPHAGADQAQGGDGAAALAGDLDALVKVAAQRDEYLALAQRTQADFENYRKRVARDPAGAHERGATGLAKELLPALDNLDRAIEAAQEDDPL